MRWLNDTEQRAWLGLVATFAGLDQALDRQLQRDAGVSHALYGVLAVLSDAKDGTRHMSELAGSAGFSQSRLSHAVARLERDGLIERSSCPSDKRAVHATLTAAGRRLVEKAAPAHVDAVRSLVFDRLTAEQTAALADITRILYDGLAAEGVTTLIPRTALR